jgi:hypothetical protein
MMHFAYMDKIRGGRDFTQEEMDSCMTNQVNQCSVESFKLLPERCDR